MSSKRYIGIDLGTSNSAIAECTDGVKILTISQKIAPDLDSPLKTLPSAVYLPQDYSCEVGMIAKEMAAKRPQRTVISAKSWLCNKQVSPYDKILPWGSPLNDIKVSPLEVSTSLLSHIRQKANFDEKVNWQECKLTLTVPASFDESARQLTLEAATTAGFQNVSLLEEPLAALYSWIGQDEKSWKSQVEHGDLILVCDIGGGTSDFSLVAVTDIKGNLHLERIAVGQHLLLGGDNMDLALAFRAKVELESQGTYLDETQFASLIHQAGQAKEELMCSSEQSSIKVGIASQGSDLFASAISLDIPRSWISEIIEEGFFPQCEISAKPQMPTNSGLMEFGLQYESDPAITKHLASFLCMAAKNIQSDPRLLDLAGKHLSENKNFLKPSSILFNGGVFKAAKLRRRLLEHTKAWCGSDIKELLGSDFDLAVAKGAAYFSKIKDTASTLRIRSGTAHSFYLGVESGGLPIPGFTPPTKGVCLVPQGTEEGTHLRLENRLFSLKAGQDVQFKFYSTPERAGDKLGDVIADADRDLQKQFVVKAHIPHTAKEEDSYPVWLDAEIDDMGTMQLRMQHTQSEKSWKLQFDVRSHD